MDLGHKDRLTCPWCGREVTAIDLSRAKGRKSLRQTELTVLIHAKGDALYADALVLYKDYADRGPSRLVLQRLPVCPGRGDAGGPPVG